MSKFTDIKKQYDDFVAVWEAVEKNKPGTVEIVYRKYPGSEFYDSLFVFDPEKDHITIRPQRNNISHVNIDVKDIPSLIEALRDFFE